MFKLDLKRQRNQRSNCQHPLDHRKSKRIPEQHLLLLIDYAKAFDCVDHNKLENSERDWNNRPPDLPSEKSICRSGSNSQNWTQNNRLVSKRERSIRQGCILSPCLFNLCAESISGSGTYSTQGLRPRHRREWSPERTPRNSHGY